MNPLERWEKIGKPSEMARLEQLKAGFISEDKEWMDSHEALEDNARRDNDRQRIIAAYHTSERKASAPQESPVAT